MKAYLRTRGRTRDYTFLGDAPKEPWWTRYGNQTAFEEPTLLAESDGGTWRVWLSGIPSSRTDRVGTPIRYSLVIEAQPGDAEALGTAAPVLDRWLEGAVGDEPGRLLGTELDRRLDEDFIERALQVGSTGNQIVVARRTLEALKAVPQGAEFRCSEYRDLHPGQSWCGSVEVDEARRQFSVRVRALLQGLPGSALFLNLLSNEEEARAVVRDSPYAPVAILVQKGTGALQHSVVVLEKKNRISRRRPQSRRRRQRAVCQCGQGFSSSRLCWHWRSVS